MAAQGIIDLAMRNIRQAVKDYGAHTSETTVLDDISNAFVKRLAEDSADAKSELRELFRKSPVWNEELQALVINGTRTHDPSPEHVRFLGQQILRKFIQSPDKDCQKYEAILDIINFFACPDDPDCRQNGIDALAQLAPKAYAPGKKLSRVFRAFCKEMGVVDDTAGSEFQKLYAQFADELSAKKIDFKLFVSINPAHFLTMSNPKYDERGDMLISCHSLNQTDYGYNCGCTGYARDRYTFIVFTVDDPSNSESPNNRKTSRQIFAYKPGSGLLLQSRMYDSSGGTVGAQKESVLYRDLVQREISSLENVPNLWKTSPATGDKRCLVKAGNGFGGYPDWVYEPFDAKISLRCDAAPDVSPLKIGTYGLCVCCAEETSEGVYCESCAGAVCDECECRCASSDLIYVYDSEGEEIRVCQGCLCDHYTCCDCCDEYYEDSCITVVNEDYICPVCLAENFRKCDDCGECYRNRDMTEVDGDCICPDCIERNYTQCEECGNYCKNDDMIPVEDEHQETIFVCDHCSASYTECSICGEYIHNTLIKRIFRKADESCWESCHVCPGCLTNVPEFFNEMEEESA